MSNLSREEFIEHALDVIARQESLSGSLEMYQALIEMGYSHKWISEQIHERSEDQRRRRGRKLRDFLG